MTCVGACCAAFPLGGLTYAELEERYHRLRDGATIFDMVRPLTHEEAHARLAALGADRDLREDRAMFRCVRWDERTRLCTRYDERPELCSDYPYEWECDHTSICTHAEPRAVRFKWLAVRQRAPQEWWYNGARWVPIPLVASLTFPG